MQYNYDEYIRRNIFFIIDAIVVATVLAGMHLSLVITLTLLFALIFSALTNKISMMTLSLSTLISIFIFYINTIFVFGFEDYFQQTSVELTILSFIGLILFITISGYYNQARVRALEKQKNNYFTEMNRYIELSNQLSRYAPLH